MLQNTYKKAIVSPVIVSLINMTSLHFQYPQKVVCTFLRKFCELFVGRHPIICVFKYLCFLQGVLS